MLLAIDVGNTETKLGCFADGPDALTENWRVTTERHRTPDEYGVFFTQLFATGGIDASAIDAHRDRQRRAATRSDARTRVLATFFKRKAASFFTRTSSR